jgi:hypothetical protein
MECMDWTRLLVPVCDKQNIIVVILHVHVSMEGEEKLLATSRRPHDVMLLDSFTFDKIVKYFFPFH